jgi:molybdopterin/thiamine biosynthesis adenylyltransferase
LQKSTRCSSSLDNHYFGIGENQLQFKNINEYINFLDIALLFKEECALDIENISSKVAGISHQEILNHVSKLFPFLIDIEQNNKNSLDDRYSRNLFYYSLFSEKPFDVQNRIELKHVTIIGCGGIGNMVSHILATSGVGNLLLVDDDTIELSNLTRQIMFSECHLGENKTKVLKDELLKKNSSVNINTLNLRISSEKHLEEISPQTDIIVLSADYPKEIALWVNNFCVRKSIPFLNCGYMNDIAVIGPFVEPGKTSCYECNDLSLFDSADSSIASRESEINKDFKIASFASVNHISAAYCANDIIRFLGGYGRPLSENKRLGICTNRFKTIEVVLEKDKDCPCCAKIQSE